MADSRSIPNQTFSAALWLVPFLIENSPISVTEIAQHFDLNAANVRKIVRTLPMVGIPSSGSPFPMPNDLFELDYDLFEHQDIVSITNSVSLEEVPRFSSRESSAMIIGLQLLKSYGMSESAIDSLVAKLSLGSEGTAPVSQIASSKSADSSTELVNQALFSGKAVTFDYQDLNGAVTTRTVVPAYLSFLGNDVLLYGFCTLREGERVFNLARSSKLRLTELDESTRAKLESASPNLQDGVKQEVVLEMPWNELKFLGAYSQDAQVHRLDEHNLRAHIFVVNPNNIKRAILASGRIKVIKPDSLRATTELWAEAALARYEH